MDGRQIRLVDRIICLKDCTNLEGGAGTIYDDTNPKDKTYAHIDGGTSNPGYFTKAKDIADCEVDPIADYKYTGSAIEPEPVVKDGETVLVKSTDYTVAYSNNVEVGTATVTIKGMGGYSGTKEVYFKINKSNALQIIDAVTLEEFGDRTYNFGVYDGKNHVTDSLVASVGGTPLTSLVVYQYSDDDGETWYSISSSTSIRLSTNSVEDNGKVLVKVEDPNYETAKCSMTIKLDAADITDATRFTVSDIEDQTYTGKALTPDVVIYDAITAKNLINGTDYDVAYTDNTNVGTAKVTVPGKGNYTGTIETSFNIVAKSIEGCSIEPIPDQSYTGSVIEPEPVVKDGETTLIKDKDYKVTYLNNTNVGTATVTITGIGNYTGTKVEYFNINKSNALQLIDASSHEVFGDRKYDFGEYDGEEHCSDGVIAAIGSKPLEGEVTYQFSSDEGVSWEPFTAEDSFVCCVQDVISYKLIFKVENPNYETAFCSVACSISAADISNTTRFIYPEIQDQVYTGEEITPEIVIHDNITDKNLVKGTDYTVSYSNNVEIGTANATVTGIGNYTGTQDQTFTIKEAQNNTPSNPDSAQTVSNNSDGSTSSKTGDNSISTIAMVLAAVVLSAAAIAFAGTRRRNRK